MSDMAPSAPQAVAGEQAVYESALEQALAEVNRLNELMRQDRTEIERLRGESWALRAETRAVLTAMGAQL